MIVPEISTWASSPTTVATSITDYWVLGNTELLPSGTEANRQLKRNAAGTFSQLYARLSANTITASSTVRFRKNTANGNQTFSIGASTSGEFSDASNTDTIAATDLVAVQLVTGGTGTNMTPVAMGAWFAATTNTVQCLAFSCSGSPTAATTQRFMNLMGGTDGGLITTAEADAQFKFAISGTLQALSISTTSNTASVATTAVSRINTANGNQTVSIAASSTGQFQDLTHTDAVSSGTLACVGISVASGGTGTFTLQISYCELATTNSTCVAGATGLSGLTQGLSVTAYYPWTGLALAPGFSTESSAQIKNQYTYKASTLEIDVRNNTITAASTLRLRKGAANANQNLSITASTSGYFQDTTNYDMLLAGDEMNYQLVTGGTGTQIQLCTIATHLQQVFRHTILGVGN